MTHVPNTDAGSVADLSEYVGLALNKCYVIPVAKVCNAGCVFCATDVYAPAYINEMMQLEGLAAKLRQLVAAGVDRFEVTGGGEPTLHPKLGTVLQIIRAEAPSAVIKLYSNGSRIRYFAEIDELNISRCAVSAERNQELMHIAGGSPELGELLRRVRSWGYPYVRLSVPIIRGGVETVHDAVHFVRSVEELVDCIVFRPLYPATPERESVSPEVDPEPWERKLSSVAASCRVEVDSLGCFRSEQLILSSDLRLFGDWSMSRPIVSAR